MPPFVKELIGQTLSVIALIVTIVSYQFNDKRKLLIAQTLSTALLSVSFFFTGETAGFALNIVGIVRNICYYFQPKRGKIPYFTGAFFAVAMCVVGCFTAESAAALLIIVALMANAVCMSVLSTQGLRISILFTCTAIMIYDLIGLNFGAAANEGFSIVSSIIGIVRYERARRRAKKNTQS